MSEMSMVEKVARASMHAALSTVTNPPTPGVLRMEWSHNKTVWMNCALAAIEAMREPTLDMWDAGDEAIPVSPPGNDPSYAMTAWHAMIDAALP